jgi:NTP pyrophosphatase (non-canonical NTP hydrolase)
VITLVNDKARAPRVYIATSTGNIAAHNALRDHLHHRGVELTYDWTQLAHHNGAEGWWSIPFAERENRLRDVAQEEVQGVQDADLLVVLLPGRKGTHVELGVAIASGVPVLIVPDTINDVGIDKDTVPFYRYPGVRFSEYVDLVRVAEQVQHILRRTGESLAPAEVILTDRRSSEAAMADCTEPAPPTMGELMTALDNLVHVAHENSRAHGFWDPGEGSATFVERIALVISECAEVIEEVRENRPVTEIRVREDGKPLGIPTELADILIRVLDIAGGYGIEIGDAVAMKMRYNAGRPHKHGKALRRPSPRLVTWRRSSASARCSPPRQPTTARRSASTTARRPVTARSWGRRSPARTRRLASRATSASPSCSRATRSPSASTLCTE